MAGVSLSGEGLDAFSVVVGEYDKVQETWGMFSFVKIVEVSINYECSMFIAEYCV